MHFDLTVLMILVIIATIIAIAITAISVLIALVNYLKLFQLVFGLELNFRFGFRDSGKFIGHFVLFITKIRSKAFPATAKFLFVKGKRLHTIHLPPSTSKLLSAFWARSLVVFEHQRAIAVGAMYWALLVVFSPPVN